VVVGVTLQVQLALAVPAVRVVVEPHQIAGQQAQTEQQI
jgi:hypothetical protein